MRLARMTASWCSGMQRSGWSIGARFRLPPRWRQRARRPLPMRAPAARMEQVMMQRQMRPSGLTRLAHRGLSWSSEHGESLALAAALLLLEALPVEAWPLVLAGTTPTRPSAVAVPIWFLIVLLVVACDMP